MHLVWWEAYGRNCLTGWKARRLNMYVSFYLYLSKHIDSDHLCYFYLPTFSSPARLFPGESILSSISITGAKDLNKKNKNFCPIGKILLLLRASANLWKNLEERKLLILCWKILFRYLSISAVILQLCCIPLASEFSMDRNLLKSIWILVNEEIF